MFWRGREGKDTAEVTLKKKKKINRKKLKILKVMRPTKIFS